MGKQATTPTIERVYDPEHGIGYHCTRCDTYAYGDHIALAKKFELRLFDDEHVGMCKTCGDSDYAQIGQTSGFRQFMHSKANQEENDRMVEEYRARHPALSPKDSDTDS